MTAELGSPSRAEWLAWRREGIGASDVAGILGLSPWASPWSVWADKLGLLPDDEPNEYMDAGRWLEPAIGPWFADKTGLTFEGAQTQCESPDDSVHRCTVDGFAAEGPNAKAWLGTVEIKVTGPGRAWTEIPAHYQAQGQWQLHVTGLERCWLAALMGRRLDIHELARDEADIALMVERVDAFWHEHVLTGKPPPTDGHDATLAALAAVYPSHVEGQAVEATAAELVELRALTTAKAAAKEAAGLEKSAKAALAAALGEAEELTVEGERVLTYRAQKRTDRCKACGHESVSEFRVMRPAKAKGTS